MSTPPLRVYVGTETEQLLTFQAKNSIPDEDQEDAQEQSTGAEGYSAKIPCLRAAYEERDEGWDR